jgi:hypothetical protein
MIIEINKNFLEISKTYQCSCLIRSHSFPRGCPNYGRKNGCPPRNLFDQDYDLKNPLYLISTDFDMTEQSSKIRLMHPNWTEKAIYNPRIGKLALENYMRKNYKNSRKNTLITQ